MNNILTFISGRQPKFINEISCPVSTFSASLSFLLLKKKKKKASLSFHGVNREDSWITQITNKQNNNNNNNYFIEFWPYYKRIFIRVSMYIWKNLQLIWSKNVLSIQS